MKIKSTFLCVTIIVIIFGGIFISSALNIWKTTASKIPEKITEGDFTGSYDPADIRGSYSFNDISKTFNIPLENLKEAFGLPDDIDPSTFKNKDLKELYEDLEEEIEIGNSSVKLFVSLYTGLPYDMDEEVYLPQKAVDILKNRNSLSKEQIEYLDNHTVNNLN
ncbi:hypothetical protein [Maledivibacter halophilus]|uniref:Uncharacterized protein n=1 Tax=Maledivibacter halophilus TaxID=36842 RepID=A0A1T5K6S3_9FIRM|nr:hypothetical protein [Maledivibacter halophilus]SKC59158.1 hypothetical protein SAMN02194393_01657 [Maledivibacter halophilus]